MSYHRFALDSNLVDFETEAMATHKLLTLKLSTPASWIAYPNDMAGRDPDNLMLGKPVKVVLFFWFLVLANAVQRIREELTRICPRRN